VLHVFGVPELPCRHAQHLGFADEGVFRPRAHPVEERRPDTLCLLLRESLEQHRDHEALAAEDHLLAPVRVHEIGAIEAERLIDQGAVGGIGARTDKRFHGSKPFG
jgi:hypothetical protein